MSTWSVPLADPPSDPRERELWLQNVAGFILMHDLRARVLEQVPPTPEAAVDLAMWQLMDVIDGVVGAMHNQRWKVRLRTHVELVRRTDDSEEPPVEQDLDLFYGDGMGLGLAAWYEGDYGNHPILAT